MAVLPVQRAIRVGEPVAEAQTRFAGYFTPWLGQGGFLVESQTADTLVYARRSFNTWQIVVAILFFPLGLLALLAEKRREQLSVFFRDEGDGKTEITVTGGVVQRNAGQLQEELDKFDPATRGVIPGE